MVNLFPWFLRSRASGVFRARSSTRDQQADTANIRSIAATIERSLSAMEAERVGLSHRMEDVRVRTSIIVGNEAEEYLSREKEETAWLGKLERELQNGDKRLDVLRQNIAHLKFLRAALFSRFPIASSQDQLSTQPVG
jgi:hypothetical protein